MKNLERLNIRQACPLETNNVHHHHQKAKIELPVSIPRNLPLTTAATLKSLQGINAFIPQVLKKWVNPINQSIQCSPKYF